MRYDPNLIFPGQKIIIPPEEDMMLPRIFFQGYLMEREGFTVLMRGSIGPTVTMLQRRLKELGYDPGPVNGTFGRLTEEAVRNFQSDMGFPETGIVEDVTWAALGF